jgi:hypothetical protein
MPLTRRLLDAELRKNVPRGMLVTTGEHEATR